MSTSLRWTSADLEVLPDDGKRREIIDGELYVSKQPNWVHQAVCTDFWYVLQTWSDRSGDGRALVSPGVIFADDDDVVPDVVWISKRRLAEATDSAGHLRAPPQLVVEVLSPGRTNEERDLDVKLKLYSRRGVDEYWVANWRNQSVRVYRRAGTVLDLVASLGESDTLTSPLLPGFAQAVSFVFRSLETLPPRPS